MFSKISIWPIPIPFIFFPNLYLVCNKTEPTHKPHSESSRNLGGQGHRVSRQTTPTPHNVFVREDGIREIPDVFLVQGWKYLCVKP